VPWRPDGVLVGDGRPSCHLRGMASPPRDRDESKFGEGPASFLAAGGEAGLRKLVDEFFDEMERAPEARGILRMHPSDLAVSRDKLARFLCGWLGGPHRYTEKYGRIRLPHAHAHLPIGEAERDAWLGCMMRAIARQPLSDAFKDYLFEQLCIPAERIRQVCERDREG